MIKYHNLRFYSLSYSNKIFKILLFFFLSETDLLAFFLLWMVLRIRQSNWQCFYMCTITWFFLNYTILRMKKIHVFIVTFLFNFHKSPESFFYAKRSELKVTPHPRTCSSLAHSAYSKRDCCAGQLLVLATDLWLYYIHLSDIGTRPSSSCSSVFHCRLLNDFILNAGTFILVFGCCLHTIC